MSHKRVKRVVAGPVVRVPSPAFPPAPKLSARVVRQMRERQCWFFPPEEVAPYGKRK